MCPTRSPIIALRRESPMLHTYSLGDFVSMSLQAFKRGLKIRATV
jgi:hypothetical protein